MKQANLINLPVATMKDVPEHLKSFLGLQDDGQLPVIPMASVQAIKQQAKLALFRYVSTPGLCTTPLAPEEKCKLAAIEVWAYNKALEIQEDNCDFNTGKYIADLVIGPPVTKSESVQVTGDIKDWQDKLEMIVEDVTVRLQEAKQIEKERYERATTTP